jgi:hypothetical protein
MLSILPDAPFVRKVPGRFPSDCSSLLEEEVGRIDIVITYSVIQYVFVDASIFDFVDRSLLLLAPGGSMLIGDIPNVSRRKRFFSSPAGVRYHQVFMGTSEHPTTNFNSLEIGKIDDAVVLGILARCRSAGFDAFVVPQQGSLPMANRREDILICRP